MNTGYHAQLLPLDFLQGAHRPSAGSFLKSPPVLVAIALLVLAGALLLRAVL